MSIIIHKERCIGCGKCEEVCPGNLIRRGTDGRAVMQYPKDCWGCTSCIKECSSDAIGFFLGADIGGRGSELYAQVTSEQVVWRQEKPDGSRQQIVISKKEANKY